MKSHSLKIILTAMFMSMAAGVASAYDAYINGIYYDFHGDWAMVTYQNGPDYNRSDYTGTVIIPKAVTYNGKTYSVTSIGKNAFSRCSRLTSVTIPNSVTNIGNSAFNECDGLKSITIPESVTKIDEYAFFGSNIQKVFVSDIAFWCNISFGNLLSNPLYNALLICNGKEITNLVIPDGVTNVSQYAFCRCKSLTSVTIPNSVTSIGRCAFWGCNDLKSITIGSGVTTIEEEAFENCSGLTSIVIPSSVTSIDERSFYGCSGLTSVIIPNNVTAIGNKAFSECKGLTSVTIGNSVHNIGDQSFANCTHLENVFCYAEEVPCTSNNAFEDSYIEYSALHVPAASLESYRTTLPWSGFGTIVAADIPATSVSLNPTTLSFNAVNQTATLTATVMPSSATNKNVTWTSSNTSVATVNSTGVVTSKGNGTATITATTTDGTNLSSTCEVTVSLPVLATGISLNQTTLSFSAANQTATLIATVTPSNATNKDVTWKSSNTTVATVSNAGVVTSIANGTATITATTTDGTNLSATCEVTVSLPVLATGISLNRTSLSFNATNQTATLIATVVPSNASNKEVTWTSSNTSVATVSSTGVVTSLANGTAIITAKTTDGTNLSAICSVIVLINHNITISDVGYATFFDSKYDWILPSGLSAQVVTGVSNNKLTYEKIYEEIVPKGTAVMLVGQQGTYTLTATANMKSYTGTNLLHGSDEATMTTGDGYHYKLSYGKTGTTWDNVFGWYWGAQDGAPFQIEGHKAWLVVPASASIRAYGYSLDDDDATGITDMEFSDENHDIYYDIQGRRISTPANRGIYIKNGKKVVIK